MAYSYNGLWKMLIDKKMMMMMKKDLMALTDITSTTMAKMGKELPVNLEILGRVCRALDCDIGDIVSYVSDTAEENESGKRGNKHG